MTASPVQGGALLPSALRAATSLPEGGKAGNAPVLPRVRELPFVHNL